MYKIVDKRLLTENIYLMDIEAPRVAKSAEPGQFVIIKTNEIGERIPLTIADYNRENGTVSIVFQTVGVGTQELAQCNIGDFVMDFVGPLGQPSEFIHENIDELKKKKIIFIAGGVGAAPIYPQV
ncbi:MAG: FAD-binding oxidoreductase, partial [Sarcina sp.]